MTVFLATLGQRPEAVTMALDVLLPRYSYDEVIILHTDPDKSGIATALKQLMHVLKTDYPNLSVCYKTLTHPDGQPLIDISDQLEAEAYYRALLEIMREYRIQFIPLHLLVAGGRKSMSIYAALAAGLLFGEQDRVWTIHTPQELMKIGVFHAPAGARDQIKMIQLPVSPSRLLPGVLAGEDIQHLLERSQYSPRQMFFDALTGEESRLAETMRQHPYATNEELGEILGKSHRTIENQLRSMYSKLFSYFDLHIEDKRKRQALLDVIAGRV